ncbi:MAG: hypothetical protein EOP06_26670 [Proteobacteria bacterium]|nr:MAG: hypothetical protein EOP06_26670 [Pseudomonadota bacterium]
MKEHKIALMNEPRRKFATLEDQMKQDVAFLRYIFAAIAGALLAFLGLQITVEVAQLLIFGFFLSVCLTRVFPASVAASEIDVKCLRLDRELLLRRLDPLVI